MYTRLREMSTFDRVEVLTRTLVGIESINGSAGEVEIANFIKEVLLDFPYFRENPDQVWEQPVPDNPLGRKNIFALVKSRPEKKTTVIYHSHTDTVGIEDFGKLKEHALNPDELADFFASYERQPDVQKDALSGDWLFGRGSVDMQSGIAVHLANMLYFSEHLDELSGNVLLMLNPDEESEHSGIISAISELRRLQDQNGLDFVVAINNDYVTPLYDGDPHRYVYAGVAGKLLPSFYIRGREAHVGEALSGIDPNLIAAEITRRVHNNVGLIEDIEGELTLPPACLYQRDNKEAYDVQTAASASLYFNYFTYERTAQEVMNTLLDVAAEATREVARSLQEQYKKFCRHTGLPAQSFSWEVVVTSLADYTRELAQRGMEPERVAREAWEQHKDLEPRMLCFKIVEALQNQDPANKARVIGFFAPPYLPRGYLNEEKEEDRPLLAAIREVLEEVGEETDERFALKRFFPYLADGSFLSLRETDEQIRFLIENFPQWECIYPVPIKEIRALNVSSVNVGAHGKDAHKWTERVHKTYTFGVLPGLIRAITRRLLDRVNV